MMRHGLIETINRFLRIISPVRAKDMGETGGRRDISAWRAFLPACPAPTNVNHPEAQPVLDNNANGCGSVFRLRID